MTTVLTTKSVESRKPDPTKRLEIPDGGLPGLYLVVQPSGLKSWAFRYRFAGQPRKFTIGTVLIKRDGDAGLLPPIGAAMTLREARTAARMAIQAIAEGTDPAGEKKAAKARQQLAGDVLDRDLVRAQGEAFVARYCRPRNRAWREVERQFRVEINPRIGQQRVDQVTKRDIRELLDIIVDRGSPVTANRVFASLRRFFSWLVERDVIASSPCAGLKMPSAETSRDRILSDEEIRLVWRASHGLGFPFGPMVRLLLITGQRREEVSGLLRPELDMDVRTWVIPRERTKNGKEHAVPLSTLAVETIEGLPEIAKCDFLFSTTGKTRVSGYSRAKDRLDALIIKQLREEAEARGDDPYEVEPPAHWTLHDLRRTVASGMAKLGIQLPIIEKVLNHTSGSFAGIVGVYQRHTFVDEKRAALDTWASFLSALVDEEAHANVVRLHG